MHYSHTRWIVKVIILLLFTTILPFQSSELYAQSSSSSKSAAKKKRTSKSTKKTLNLLMLRIYRGNLLVVRISYNILHSNAVGKSPLMDYLLYCRESGIRSGRSANRGIRGKFI